MTNYERIIQIISDVETLQQQLDNKPNEYHKINEFFIQQVNEDYKAKNPVNVHVYIKEFQQEIKYSLKTLHGYRMDEEITPSILNQAENLKKLLLFKMQYLEVQVREMLTSKKYEEILVKNELIK